MKKYVLILAGFVMFSCGQKSSKLNGEYEVNVLASSNGIQNEEGETIFSSLGTAKLVIEGEIVSVTFNNVTSKGKLIEDKESKKWVIIYPEYEQTDGKYIPCRDGSEILDFEKKELITC